MLGVRCDRIPGPNPGAKPVCRRPRRILHQDAGKLKCSNFPLHRLLSGKPLLIPPSPMVQAFSPIHRVLGMADQVPLHAAHRERAAVGLVGCPHSDLRPKHRMVQRGTPFARVVLRWTTLYMRIRRDDPTLDPRRTGPS